MKITVAVITPQDYKKFNVVGMNAEACLADRVKLICQDDAGHVAESFMKRMSSTGWGWPISNTTQSWNTLRSATSGL